LQTVTASAGRMQLPTVPDINETAGFRFLCVHHVR